MGSPVQKLVVDDQELKNRIIQRYSFVDKDDDVREHRPVAPKSVSVISYPTRASFLEQVHIKHHQLSNLSISVYKCQGFILSYYDRLLN